MQMLDRVKGPLQREIQLGKLPIYQCEIFNEIAVYQFPKQELEITAVEFRIKAGKWFETQNMLSRICAAMLRLGSEEKTALAFAEEIDELGASLNIAAGFDMVVVRFSCLSIFSLKLLNLVERMMLAPSFPEDELQLLLKRRKASQQIKEQKNDYKASALFNELMFGPNHPYGKRTQLVDFDNIDQQKLQQHHQQFYTKEQTTVFVAGRIEEDLIKAIENTCHRFPTNQIQEKRHFPSLAADKEYIINELQLEQTAIRLGCPIFNKKDDRVHRFMIFNSLFGGYFSSRLMKNIREEKGFTYGIYSVPVFYKNAAYFCIMSDIGTAYTQACFKEISKELQRLKAETVSLAELNRLKSYLKGAVVGQVDGVFSYAKYMAGLIMTGFDEEHIYSYFKQIEEVNANDIQEMANYLPNFENMHRIAMN